MVDHHPERTRWNLQCTSLAAVVAEAAEMETAEATETQTAETMEAHPAVRWKPP